MLGIIIHNVRPEMIYHTLSNHHFKAIEGVKKIFTQLNSLHDKLTFYLYEQRQEMYNKKQAS